MTYRIRASDRAAFKRCRRAWDLGSRNRQNFEPVSGPGGIDLDAAVRAALAVYYFPGMWEWNRAIVQPLVHQALDRSIHGQLQAQRDDQAIDEVLDRGHALLDAYAMWAPSVDHFTPVRIDTDFEVDIPDPTDPDLGLVTRDGEAIRYTDRVDLLVIDNDDTYWAIQHRLVFDGWAEDDILQLDERTIAWCWAWPLFYLGMRVAGTVYNEIRADSGELAMPELDAAKPDIAPPALHPQVRHRRMYARADAVPRERVRSEGTDAFRRTRIPRGEAELSAAGADIATEASTAARADVEIYPSPESEICARCAYTPPCLVLNEGGDPAAELARSYRRRPPEPVEEGRLGGATWSMNRGAAPPRWPGDP
jgi:hypothetical protein